MKIAVISDIHVDINENYDVKGAMVDYLKDKAIELLLIAGDLSSDPDQSITFAKELEKESGVKVFYVPGNHDLWNRDGQYENNDEIYQMFLEDPRCLSGKSFAAGDYVIIGDAGWYDFSFGNKKFSEDDFKRMSYHGRIWQDSIFNSWSKTSEETCGWFIERLKEEAEKYRGKKIVLMTHMLSHKAFTVPEDRADWSYFNAFLGSEKLHEFCKEYNVAYAICGHVHYRKTFNEDHTTYMCRCLNYHTEWFDGDDIKEQLERTFEIIEL